MRDLPTNIATWQSLSGGSDSRQILPTTIHVPIQMQSSTSMGFTSLFQNPYFYGFQDRRRACHDSDSKAAFFNPIPGTELRDNEKMSLLEFLRAHSPETPCPDTP